MYQCHVQLDHPCVNNFVGCNKVTNPSVVPSPPLLCSLVCVHGSGRAVKKMGNVWDTYHVNDVRRI